MRLFVRMAALPVTIGCAAAFLSGGTEASGNNGKQTSRMYIGRPWPWYESRMEQEVRPDGSSSSRGESGLRRSPAWFVFGCGAVGLLAFRLLRAPESRAVTA